MRPHDPRFTAVILAAQRPGRVDPLAERAGLSHKCLVPIAEVPLIAHVVAALAATPGCALMRIVIEPAMFVTLRTLLGDGPPRIELVVAADNLADSVFNAADGIEGPIIVTTADNVLLTPEAVRQMVATLEGGADVALAMAARASVLMAHPEGQRRFYRFRDDDYSNCNLYGFGHAGAIKAAESFRSGGQFAKKPLRLIGAIGLVNVVLMLLRRLSLAGALARLSRRLGLSLAPVVIADGSHAIDVDNERTYRIAEMLLERRRRIAATPERHPRRMADSLTA